MNNNFEYSAEQAAAFQKLWMQSASKMLQATLLAAPNTDPESLRQMRSGVFQALAQSWEEFMRSPQFLDCMKQGMENAVAFRKMSGDFLAKMRNEMQAPSRDDVDTIMISIRHLETRLLDRMDAISAQIDVLKPKSQRNRGTQAHRASGRASPSSRRRAERKREEAV